LSAPLVYFGARILSALVGITAIALFTRLISPQEYGTFTLAMAAVVTVFEIFYQWIRAGMLRFLPRQDAIEGPSMAAAILGYVWVSLIILAIVVMASLVPAWQAYVSLFWLCYFLLLAMAALELALISAQSRGKVLLYGGLTLVRAVGMLSGGAALVSAGWGASGILLGYALAMALPVLCLALSRWRRLVSMPFADAQLKAMFRFGGAMTIVSIAGSVIGLSDRYMIAWLVDVGEAGLYGAPYDLANRGLKLLLLSSFLAYSPAVFRHFDKKDQHRLKESMTAQIRLMLGVAVPLGVAMAMAAPLVARLFLGEDFRDGAIQLMPWLVAAALIQGTSTYYLSYGYTLTHRVAMNALVVSACALLNLALNALLIPPMGALGAAIATLMTVTVLFCASILLTRRWIELPWHRADLIRIAGVCAIAAPALLWAGRLDDLLASIAATASIGVVMLLLLVAVDVSAARQALITTVGRSRKVS